MILRLRLCLWKAPRDLQTQLLRHRTYESGCVWEAAHEKVAWDKQFPSSKHPGNNPYIRELQIMELQALGWKLHFHEISILLCATQTRPRKLMSAHN